MRAFLKLVVVLSLTFLSVGCEHTSATPEEVVIDVDLRDREDLVSMDEFFTVQTIYVPDSTNFQIGGWFSDILPVEGGYLFCDRAIDALSLVNGSGKLVWSLRPDKNEVDRFSDIGIVDYYPETGVIEVFDESTSRFYQYSTAGDLLRVHNNKVNFGDRTRLIDGSFLYETKYVNNADLTGSRSYQFLRVSGDSLLHTYREVSPFDYSFYPVNDWNKFSRIDEYITFNDDLEWELLNISSASGQVEQYYRVDFLGFRNPHAILSDAAVQNKAQRISEEGIPYFNRVVLKDNRLFASIFRSADAYFVVTDGNKHLISGGYLKVGGTVHSVPETYYDGTFLSYVPAYQFDLQQALLDGASMNDVQKRISQAAAEHGDNVGGVLSVLTIR